MNRLRFLAISARLLIAATVITFSPGCGGGEDFDSLPVDAPPAPPDDDCSNTCLYAFDGTCDDGGPGSSFSLCMLGTDCSDCGSRGSIVDDDAADAMTDSTDAFDDERGEVILDCSTFAGRYCPADDCRSLKVRDVTVDPLDVERVLGLTWYSESGTVSRCTIQSPPSPFVGDLVAFRVTRVLPSSIFAAWQDVDGGERQDYVYLYEEGAWRPSDYLDPELLEIAPGWYAKVNQEQTGLLLYEAASQSWAEVTEMVDPEQVILDPGSYSCATGESPEEYCYRQRTVEARQDIWEEVVKEVRGTISGYDARRVRAGEVVNGEVRFGVVLSESNRGYIGLSFDPDSGEIRPTNCYNCDRACSTYDGAQDEWFVQPDGQLGITTGSGGLIGRSRVLALNPRSGFEGVRGIAVRDTFAALSQPYMPIDVAFDCSDVFGRYESLHTCSGDHCSLRWDSEGGGIAELCLPGAGCAEPFVDALRPQRRSGTSPLYEYAVDIYSLAESFAAGNEPEDRLIVLDQSEMEIPSSVVRLSFTSAVSEVAWCLDYVPGSRATYHLVAVDQDDSPQNLAAWSIDFDRRRITPSLGDPSVAICEPSRVRVPEPAADGLPAEWLYTNVDDVVVWLP